MIINTYKLQSTEHKLCILMVRTLCVHLCLKGSIARGGGRAWSILVEELLTTSTEFSGEALPDPPPSEIPNKPVASITVVHCKTSKPSSLVAGMAPEGC